MKKIYLLTVLLATSLVVLCQTSDELRKKATKSAMQGNVPEALEILDLAIEKYPNDFQLHIDKGLIMAMIKDYDGAIEEITKVVKIDSSFSKAYNSRGYVYQQAKKYSFAMKDFTKAIELDSNNYRFYTDRGALKMELSDNKGAISDFTKALELNSKYTNALIYRALSKIEMKDFDGACNDLSKAGELGDMRAFDLIKVNCNK